MIRGIIIVLVPKNYIIPEKNYMTQVDLNAQTYEKILDFAMLDPFATDYYKRVLSLLKSNFSINLAAYSAWLRDGRLLSYDSIGLSEDFMKQAHSIDVNDEIRNFAIEQVSSNSWDGIFYSQDADPFTYAGSKTIEHLNENHMHYFAIMVVSKKPRVNITVCKTDKEGPFTALEKEILKKICSLLCRQAQIRETHNTDRQVLEIINSHCINKKTGLIITDEDREVLTYNEAALSLVPSKLNSGHIDDIVKYIFSLFEKKESDDVDHDDSERSLTQNSRFYTLETISLSRQEGRQAKCHLITIRRNRHFDSKVSPSAAASYGLTERENAVAELIVSGYTNDEIADQLHISVHTVKIHVSNVFRKLRVHNRMEAIIRLSDKT